MNRENAMQQRRAICRACEYHGLSNAGEYCEDMIGGCTDEEGNQKLSDCIKRGICPRGKFDAVNMEARV